jgi:hypothetical protein
MRQTLILVLSLIFATPSWSAILYVDADCSNGISTYNETTQQCTGGTSTVYSSITNAQAFQSTGDTISLGDDTYEVGQLAIAATINLTSTASDKTKVTITPNTANTSGAFIRIVSTNPGTSGDQTISHVTIDGRNDGDAGDYFTHGILVKNRDDVTIHDVTIEDFYGTTGSPMGTSTETGGGSYGLTVYSTDKANGIDWYNHYGTNFAKRDWTTSPVDNFQFYNFKMDDCGEGTTERVLTGAVYLWGVSNSSIHDGEIDVSHDFTEAIYSTAAMLDNVDFYNLLLTGHSNGAIRPGDGDSQSLYLIELWLLHNCEIRNNKLIRGGISLSTGTNVIVEKNYVDFSSSAQVADTGYYIECGKINNAYIRYNRLIGGNGHPNGIAAGAGTTNFAYPTTSSTYIYRNILHNIRWHGLIVTAYEQSGGSNPPTVNAYVYNNFIDYSPSAHASYAGVITGAGYYDGSAGGGTLNFYLRNNIITNSIGTGVAFGGGEMPDTYIIDGNCILDHSVANLNPSNMTVSDAEGTEPTYTNYASDNFTMTSGTGVDPTESTDLGIPYNMAINDNTDWTTGADPLNGDTLVVGTIDADTYTPWDLGPYEYDTAGSDVTGPTISNKDPYDGEQLTYGTTSVNGDVDATDASGVEGCECNEGTFSYGDGTTMTNPSGDTYRCGLLTGLTNDTLYDDTWHYICQDSSDNSNETSGTWSFSVAPTGGGDVIVDNLDAGFSQSTSGWAGDTVRDDAYGDSHDYDTSYGAQGSGVWARWTPTITTAGTYEVYMWTFSGGHPDAAPFTIVHSSGTAIGTVNQIGSGSWVSMGTYCFNAGTDGYVQVTDEDDGYLIADAVRFEFQQSGCGGGTPSGSGFVTGGGTGYIKGN